jgi:cytochrome c551/c552
MRPVSLWIIAGLVLATSRATAQTAGNAAAGKAFALEVCTPCHVVASDQLSPRRFAVAPDFDAIANTSAMTYMALHAFLSTSHPTMPNLILSDAEERNVIAYILGLRTR